MRYDLVEFGTRRAPDGRIAPSAAEREALERVERLARAHELGFSEDLAYVRPKNIDRFFRSDDHARAVHEPGMVRESTDRFV
jgi:hypothetical protein